MKVVNVIVGVVQKDVTVFVIRDRVRKNRWDDSMPGETSMFLKG